METLLKWMIWGYHYSWKHPINHHWDLPFGELSFLIAKPWPSLKLTFWPLKIGRAHGPKRKRFCLILPSIFRGEHVSFGRVTCWIQPSLKWWINTHPNLKMLNVAPGSSYFNHFSHHPKRLLLTIPSASWHWCSESVLEHRSRSTGPPCVHPMMRLKSVDPGYQVSLWAQNASQGATWVRNSAVYMLRE